MHQPLRNIQQWFQAVITHPDGVRSGIASSAATELIDVSPGIVEQVILPSKQQSSVDRLQIYGSAYFGRLIECLKAQFPAFSHAVGDESFSAFAFGYLKQNPSNSYSLSSLGRSFDQYLSVTRPNRDESTDDLTPDFADFLIDLVRLEQNYAEVFDGPGPESSQPLRRQDLEYLSPESFADCRLIFFECVRLLELRFPVHEYASAIRNGLEPIIPDSRTTYLVITRRDYVVRRFEITSQQFRVLTAIQREATMGEAIAGLSSDSETDLLNLKQDLKIWFERWTAMPLFSRLKADSDRS